MVMVRISDRHVSLVFLSFVSAVSLSNTQGTLNALMAHTHQIEIQIAIATPPRTYLNVILSPS